MLAAMAAAEPSSAARLLGAQLSALSAGASRLAAAAAPTSLGASPDGANPGQGAGTNLAQPLPATSALQLPQEALAAPAATGGVLRGPDEGLGSTPRGLAAGELASVKPAMDAVHGFALGAAALVVAATRRAPLQMDHTHRSKNVMIQFILGDFHTVCKRCATHLPYCGDGHEASVLYSMRVVN